MIATTLPATSVQAFPLASAATFSPVQLLQAAQRARESGFHALCGSLLALYAKQQKGSK